MLTVELSVEPEPDTVALAERIRTQTPPAHPQIRHSTPQPRRPDTSVAFLENLFVGRTSEYQALINGYGLVAAGQPQLVVLHGDVGMGKTRLAKEFIAWASVQGAELLQGSAFESGSHMPFQPLVDAFRLWFEHENSPKHFLGEAWWLPLSQLLPELRQRDPDSPQVIKESGALEAEMTQPQLFEPFAQLTIAMAKRTPLVLFVDDFQWTDSATLDLLQYAIRRWRDSAARVLLLVSLRSEALHPMTQPVEKDGLQGLVHWLDRVGCELVPVYIELEPLGESETVQMVLSILSPPTTDFAQWLYAETCGQPFYLMETLKDLLERRVLHPKRRVEGQWTFVIDAEHNLGQAVRVPSTIHAVIRSRLNRLSPNAFSLLAGGAVLEQRITFDRLCVISNISADSGFTCPG